VSRTRSYELLDQARVLRTIQAAARLSDLPDISAYAATQIRARLDRVAQTIRDRIESGHTVAIGEVISEVVREHRAQVFAQDQRGRGRSHRRRAVEDTGPARLYEAVDLLAGMPPPPEFAAEVLSYGGASRLGPLEEALGWLTEFAARWPQH
jgi:hypothetical protein